jgi:hypothetical protein
MNGDRLVLRGKVARCSRQLSSLAMDGFGMGWLDGMGGRGE